MESRVAFVGTFWQKYTLAAVCHPIRTRGWWPKEGITKLDVIRYYADIEAFGQTIVAPYAVWRRPHAPVSTPLAPDEVDPKLDPARYTLRSIQRHLAGGETWQDFWSRRQHLPRVPSRARRPAAESA
jgi:DNA primase